MSSEHAPHIAVIGGGIAGLTAAYRLSQQGLRVSLWERGSRLGGQAAAFPVAGGASLEYFYHHLFQSDREIVKLIEEIGISDHLVWLPSNVGYFADGKSHPLNGALDLVKLPIIPFHDRIRLGATTFYLQHVKNWKKYEKITAQKWLTRALGKRAYDRTLGAQLDAKFGRFAGDVAMVWFWGKIWLRTTSRKSPLAKEHLGYIKGSFNVLIDALHQSLLKQGVEVHVGEGPSSLNQREDGRWDVVIDGLDEPVLADKVVVTTPSPILARLVPDLPEDYKSKLLGLTYEAAAVALLELDRPLSSIYWLNIADRDMPFTGVIEHTNFMPASDYGGKHYVYLSKYLETDHPYFTMPEEELLETYIPYVKRINPAFDRSWISNKWIFRERAAQPIVGLNYSERIPDHRTPKQGLYLANTSQIYPEDRGTNYSVRLGNQIAEIVREDLANRK
jgi:protoporphyrinogen oxidase